MSDLDWVKEQNITDGTLQIYETYFAPQLASLPKLERERPDIHSVEFRIGDVDEIKRAPKLERLGIKIQSLQAQDAFEAIERFGPSLVSLDLRPGWTPSTGSTYVTGEHLKALGKFSGLRKLNLAGCDVADKHLRHLSSHKNLESLVLLRIPYRGRGLEGISKGLISLSMGGSEGNRIVQAADIEPLKRFGELKSLGLGAFPVSDDALVPLAELPSLESLSLTASLREEGLAFLERMDRLVGFGFSKWNKPQSLKVKAAPYFKGLRSLRSLDLGTVKVNDRFFESFAELPRLQYLRVLGGSAGDKGVAALEGHPELRVLVLSGKKLTDEVFGSVARIPNLRCLHLHRSSITPEGLATLKDLPLRELSFSLVRHGDDLVPVLKELDHLKWLIVGKCNISKAGLQELRDHFGKRFVDAKVLHPNAALLWDRRKGWTFWEA